MNQLNERALACEILTDITQGGGYNNILLRKTLKKYGILTQVQKNFITELVNGTLRNMIFIDYILNLHSKTPVERMKPLIKNALRTAVYQIYFMDKTPDFAACDEAVKLVRKKGFLNLTGFVNGVLRTVIRNKEEPLLPDKNKDALRYLSIRYSYPEWLISYWMDSYGGSGIMGIEEFEPLFQANSRPPALTVCVNTLKTSPEQLKETLEAEGMEVTAGKHFEGALLLKDTADLNNSPAFREGLFHVIDEGAMAAVEALSPKPGQLIADPCAAPGGKSFYSAYRMENKGSILAGDKHPHKIELLREGAVRLGIGIISASLGDASHTLSSDHPAKDRADGVILDAPCSGFGLIRKKPDIKYTKTKEDILALSALQRELLGACQAYVKPGGILVYSTCTLSKLENEDNVDWFLSRYDFEAAGCEKLWPHIDETDGFFIAKFIRRG